ncbi:MAG TPA: nitrogenase molybdenum-iron protein alpha chain [Nitrospirae bacterium]|nr:nitrogenase molybdenum-iron protein alpha chain [bacterium BMS3Abin10]GBE39811.1 nitrogenase molybdenum-iron protein alpha chain [bacterium BMS3Bbin08]HDK17672.1 nitrogenase molybdenum-iron protein alpha chain [Nitrospirota bacterium]HDO26056.1 nitrogenase molybdenum-iron protein alpha chain [Nitrospirota bacterium]
MKTLNEEKSGAGIEDIDPDEIKQELLSKYPTKVARKRARQIIVNKVGEGGEVQEILANTRTTPGIITQRGCTYAGCKGVIMGPTNDIVNITHGPIGCGFYSWLTRRNQTRAEKENFMPYCFSTDMQDEEIIFGGEKKLRQAIQEAYDLFKPKAISIFATCPVGLIGDDVHAIAREMKEKLGINVFAFSCEGYKGVSQSAGHHIANNGIFTHVVGLDDTVREGDYKINLLGEYNIGGDSFEIERIFGQCGITLLSTFSGNSSYDQFANAHTADLNLVMCHRSINYLADMMDKKFGIPWIKINFISAEGTAKSLRKIARYFDDRKLIDRVEEVIAREMPEVEKVGAEVRERCKGKLAMLFVGASRSHHYQLLFNEIGMETISAGYEFAHRDDYEGREVLPDIKIEADSRNIEELEVEHDPERYRPRKNAEEIKKLKEQGLTFSDYKGIMVEMRNQALVIDDISHYETEKLIEIYKPAIFCAGIKEKYAIQKSGLPLKQLHSYDYGGPYAGFKGAINFYREIDRMVNSRVWSYIKAPWQESPELSAKYVWK